MFSIETVEDFAQGAPLDRFDSLDDFREFARWHYVLHPIASIDNVVYTGPVYNLSVDNTRTYVVSGVTVHNCRCYVKSLSADQVRERKLKVETEGVSVKPDEGWDYNVGKEGLLGSWDKNGHLPDCLSVDFSEGVDCIKTLMGQKTWKEYGRPDLRNVPSSERHPEPELIEPGLSKTDALELLLLALDINEDHPSRLIWTPIEPVFLVASQMEHIVEKRIDARERYANLIVPTLENPYEIYLTEYEDGMRSRYIGLFTGRNDFMVVVRINRDGSILWNVMQGRDKDMNKNRVGTLLWPK